MILSILALALILRVGWPMLAEFKRDEATVVRHALAIAYRGELPVLGQGSSLGIANLPLTYYLTAIPLRLWRDPVAAVLFVGLLNGLAVLGCYLLGRAYFGRTVGLVAAFLFAVNPWAVLYGRKIWCRTLPLVTLAFFAALFAIFVRKRPWALVGAFAALAALIGLQLEGIAFIPLLFIPMLIYRKQVALRPLMVGLLLFALAISPYVVHDALHGWPNLRGFAAYAGGEARLSWDALRYGFLLASSEGIHALAGNLYAEYRAGLPNLWWLNGLTMALLAFALVYGVLRALRGPEERRRSTLLLLLWFAIPVLLQTRSTAPVQPHYFVLLYPVQFLLVAILVVDLLSRLSTPEVYLAGRSVRVLPVLLVAALLMWGAWQVAVVGRLFVFMDRYPVTGGYGIPLKYPRTAAQEARRLAGAPEVEIIVLGEGADPEMEETPAIFDALLSGHAHRFADGRYVLPVPDDRRVVYLAGPVERGEAEPMQPILRRLEAMGYSEPGVSVPLAERGAYRLFYRGGPDREDVLAALARFPEEVPFANGVSFLGYGMAERVAAGEALEVWLGWWVRSPPPPGVDYHFFAHLVDQTGELRVQHDGAGFPTGLWRVGDLALSRFSIPIPVDLVAGSYRVQAGLYSYPDVVDVPILDAAGNPAGERLTLEEVEVVRR